MSLAGEFLKVTAIAAAVLAATAVISDEVSGYKREAEFKRSLTQDVQGDIDDALAETDLRTARKIFSRVKAREIGSEPPYADLRDLKFGNQRLHSSAELGTLIDAHIKKLHQDSLQQAQAALTLILSGKDNDAVAHYKAVDAMTHVHDEDSYTGNFQGLSVEELHFSNGKALNLYTWNIIGAYACLTRAQADYKTCYTDSGKHSIDEIRSAMMSLTQNLHRAQRWLVWSDDDLGSFSLLDGTRVKAKDLSAQASALQQQWQPRPAL